MNAKKMIIALLISLLCALAIFVVFKSDRNELREKAHMYLANNYASAEFKYIETIYRIDGGIDEVKFSKDNTVVEYSVFIVSDKIYDNYLRTDMENEKKSHCINCLKRI